jgi:hypothetical protein
MKAAPLSLEGRPLTARATWVVVKAGKYELENAQRGGVIFRERMICRRRPLDSATRGAAESEGLLFIQENFNLPVSNPRNAPALVPV